MRWTVSGGGFGHGIGMSQYGAYGFAQKGRSHGEILAHYYRGTQLGSAAGRKVRVLLQASDPYVRVRGATRAGDRELNPGTMYKVVRTGGGLAVKNGRRTVVRFSRPFTVFRHRRPIRLIGPAINGINSGLYRGGMELRAGADGGVTAINVIKVDPYIQGVVPGEMPSSWHMEALKAQAVAARTYALATSLDGGVFDLYPDTRSQVYKGVSGETSRTNSAVARHQGRGRRVRRRDRDHLLLLDLGRPHREHRERLHRRRPEALAEGRQGPLRQASRPATAGATASPTPASTRSSAPPAACARCA